MYNELTQKQNMKRCKHRMGLITFIYNFNFKKLTRNCQN